MATIVNTALSGATVTYNGIQFGGSDSNYKSLPPMYEFVGVPIYDRSNRAVKYVEVNLSVRCIFYETSVTNMANNMAAIQTALAAPGRTLTIAGLGSGFGIATAGVITADIENGPKPGPIRCVPIGGQLAWELSWSIAFRYVPCSTGSETDDAFTEFNFTTTWSNDFEGLTTRTISGIVGIKQHRDPADPNTVDHVAEMLRLNGTIVVSVPVGFKRVTNQWTETEDKATLLFTIVDQQLEGDHYPPGITQANGSFSFNAGDGKGGFGSAYCVLNMTLKTAPGAQRDLAGRLFMAIALSKQADIGTALGDTKQLVPLKLSITTGMFDSARTTQCSMVWMLTATSLTALLTAADIWKPINQLYKIDAGTVNPTSGTGDLQDYSDWESSVDDLWVNRGTANLSSTPSEATIIDLCSNTNTKTIGASDGYTQVYTNQSLPSLTCPTVGDTAGWITFDLEIVPLRKDNQTPHRKAVSYVPQSSLDIQDIEDPGTGNTAPSGGPDYSQSGSDLDTLEYHGYPENYVGMKFRALRYVNTPFMPIIKSIGGNEVYQTHEEGGQPRFAFDAFGCPVWVVEGVRVYRVLGKINDKYKIGSPVSIGASITPTEALEI